MDLHILECLEHVLTISWKYLFVCIVQKFCGNCNSKTNAPNIDKFVFNCTLTWIIVYWLLVEVDLLVELLSFFQNSWDNHSQLQYHRTTLNFTKEMLTIWNNINSVCVCVAHKEALISGFFFNFMIVSLDFYFRDLYGKFMCKIHIEKHCVHFIFVQIVQ